MYLTYAEYVAMGYNDVEEQDYPRLANEAKHALDYLTKDFYVWNALNDDLEWRRLKFKQANAYLIHYYASNGATESYALSANSGGSVTIGRTSIGSGGNNNNNGVNNSKNLVSVPNEVYMVLARTGLLYRGLGGAYGC